MLIRLFTAIPFIIQTLQHMHETRTLDWKTDVTSLSRSISYSAIQIQLSTTSNLFSLLRKVLVFRAYLRALVCVSKYIKLYCSSFICYCLLSILYSINLLSFLNKFRCKQKFNGSNTLHTVQDIWCELSVCVKVVDVDFESFITRLLANRTIKVLESNKGNDFFLRIPNYETLVPVWLCGSE